MGEYQPPYRTSVSLRLPGAIYVQGEDKYNANQDQDDDRSIILIITPSPEWSCRHVFHSLTISRVVCLVQQKLADDRRASLHSKYHTRGEKMDFFAGVEQEDEWISLSLPQVEADLFRYVQSS